MMCNDIRFLAQLDNMRWIGICEHGTIHLYWDYSVLFMHPNELNKLGWVLDRHTVAQNVLVDQRPWWVKEEAAAQVQAQFTIWIANKYALAFKPVDFLMFGSLVSHALDQIGECYITKLSSIPIRIEELGTPTYHGAQSPYDIQFSRN